MSDLRANCKLWISSNNHEGVFGGGKLHLLEAIEEYGSLREAANALKISYRKAWGDLQKAECCLQMSLIKRTRGGKGGGKSRLTEDGKKVIKHYRLFQAQVQADLERAFQQHLGGALR